MTSRLTPRELLNRYTACANRLAEWINAAPRELDVTAVYDAHAVLCTLIQDFERREVQPADPPGGPDAV